MSQNVQFRPLTFQIYSSSLSLNPPLSAYKAMRHKKILKLLLGAGLALLLGGCDAVLLSPSGDVALQQRNLIYVATGLMLIIIVPVMIATIVFAWRYRAANRKARYDADWDHSTRLELVIWSVPLLI